MASSNGDIYELWKFTETSAPQYIMTFPWVANMGIMHLWNYHMVFPAWTPGFGVETWISDGTAHQWITPSGEATQYPQGVSVSEVPDMAGVPGVPGMAALSRPSSGNEFRSMMPRMASRGTIGRLLPCAK